MLIGMSVVFLFLICLVLILNLTAFLSKRLAGSRPEMEHGRGSATERESATEIEQKIAVAIAAITAQAGSLGVNKERNLG